MAIALAFTITLIMLVVMYDWYQSVYPAKCTCERTSPILRNGVTSADFRVALLGSVTSAAVAWSNVTCAKIGVRLRDLSNDVCWSWIASAEEGKWPRRVAGNKLKRHSGLFHITRGSSDTSIIRVRRGSIHMKRKGPAEQINGGQQSFGGIFFC